MSQSLRGDQVFLGNIMTGFTDSSVVSLNPSVVIRSFWGVIWLYV